MDRVDAVALVDRIHGMCSRPWGDGRVNEWVKALGDCAFPARHVSGALDKLFVEMDPDRITLPKLLEACRAQPIGTWIPQLIAPPRDPFEPIPWREPDPKNLPTIPLERPDPEFRRRHRAQMRRMREDTAAYLRERRSEGKHLELRAILLRLAAKWVEAVRHCDFCGVRLTVPLLEEFIDWSLTGPPEGTAERVFCRECAPRAIEQIDGRITRLDA